VRNSSEKIPEKAIVSRAVAPEHCYRIAGERRIHRQLLDVAAKESLPLRSGCLLSNFEIADQDQGRIRPNLIRDSLRNAFRSADFEIADSAAILRPHYFGRV
jgi:hypothetical protein